MTCASNPNRFGGSRTRRAALAGLLALVATGADASPYYSGNPYSPIPPGCVTNPYLQTHLYGANAVEVWQGEVPLRAASRPLSTDPADLTQANLRILRIACAEPGRSALMAVFQVPVEPTTYPLTYLLPEFGAEIFDSNLPLVPVAEPNDGYGDWLGADRPGPRLLSVFGDYTGGWYDVRGWRWAWLLDGLRPSQPPAGFNYAIGADPYNDAFTLTIYQPGAELIRIPVPATADVLEPNPTLPLNGRLSGHWVEAGAGDQGLILSFSSRVPPASGVASAGSVSNRGPLLVFLSWYTFDAAGQPLWLTGVGWFGFGASEVTLSIEHVTDGAFLGATRAQRSEVGQAILSARACNHLNLSYSLPGLGLGSGTARLERLHQLEIAGYPCRDFDARLEALHGWDY